MENFSPLEIPFESSLFSNEAYVVDSVLHFQGNQLPLSFTTKFVYTLPYDILLIDTQQNLYKVNKYQKNIDNFGEIIDEIIYVTFDHDIIIIITTNEIIKFNSYFEVTDSKKLKDYCDNLLVKDVIFGDSMICLLSNQCIVILENNLSMLSIVHKNFTGCCFISRYNLFACFSNKIVEFIEPNGMNHSEPLYIDESETQDESKQATCCHSTQSNLPTDIINKSSKSSCCHDIKSTHSNDILEAKQPNCDTSSAEPLSKTLFMIEDILLVNFENKVLGYYMKNFVWYRKFTLPDQIVVSVLNGHIKTSTNSYYRIFNSLSVVSGESFVINYNEIHYTNLSVALIPVPYYFKKITVNSQINGFIYKDQKLFVLENNMLTTFKIQMNNGESNIAKISEFAGNFLGVYSFEIIDHFLITNKGLLFDISSKNSLAEKSFLQNFSKNIQQKLSEGETVFRILDFENPTCLFLSGLLLYGDVFYKFNPLFEFVDIKMNNNSIYLLSKCVLQEIKVGKELNEPKTSNISVIATNVTSFYFFKKYLVHSTNNGIFLNNSLSSYCDENTRILFIYSNKIILYSRFGSLETITNKVFTLELISDYLNKNEIKSAAKLCDQFHVDYSVFKDDFSNYIPFLSDFQCISLFESHFTKPMKNVITFFEFYNFIEMNWEKIFNKKISNLLKEKESNGFIDSLKYINKNESSSKMYEILKKNENGSDEYYIYNVKSKERSKININNDKMYKINKFMALLNPEVHLGTIITILIYIDRIDLCFFIGENTLQKVIKILTTKIQPEIICKESLKTLNLEIIEQVHKICHKDYSMISNFISSARNVPFSVYDFLEDKKTALFYLIDEIITLGPENNVELVKTAFEYALNNNLLTTLIMTSYFDVLNLNHLLIDHFDSITGFYLLLQPKFNKELTMNSAAFEFALNNLLWKEFIQVTETDWEVMANRLSINEKWYDLGQLYEKMGHYENGIINFIKAGKYYDGYKCLLVATSLIVNFESLIINESNKIQYESLFITLKNESRNLLMSYILSLKCSTENLIKYSDRLKVVRSRIEQNIESGSSCTSFSYTSSKSYRRALTSDRPNGLYENEFVMNRIRVIVDELMEIVKFINECLEIITCKDIKESKKKEFNNKNEYIEFLKENSEDELIISYLQAIEPITEIANSVNAIWDYKRPDSEINVPNVMKPSILDCFI